MAIILNTAVVGQADVNRLMRETNTLDDFFAGAQAREPGSSVEVPQTTSQLEELAKLNKLSLLEAKDRTKLTKLLNELIKEAPRLQVSFAVEPPPRVVETILSWMRDNLHPNVLLQIGLQPNIGAGVVVRTANREFDLSMRQHLLDSRRYLAELIEEVAKKVPDTPVAVPVPTKTVVAPGPQTAPMAPAPMASPPAPQVAAPPPGRIEVKNG